MRITTASFRLCTLLALLAVSAVQAQGNVPDLKTATQPGATTASSASSTGASSTSNTASPTGKSSSATSSSSTAAATSSTLSGSTTSQSATFTATFPDATSTTNGAGKPFSLTGLPTIAGAGIPTMVIPYTANAPFMQKSALPEGTVFIAVGAVLAFLGACVLLWRGMVAWSINRSVKRNSRAAMGGSEKGTGWGRGGGGGGGGGGAGNKGAYYKEYEMGSTMSLDALNSNGKANRHSTFPDEGKRQSSAPPAGLFFSPTAQTSNRASSANFENRGSSYLPAGYYASPNSELAGGRGSTVIGSSLAPYARNSTVNPSPPGSRAGSHNFSSGGIPHPTSREGLRSQDGFRVTSREGQRAPPSRDGYTSQRNSSVLYNQPSTSSLMVGTGVGGHASNEHLGGQRAPSAVLDELFENHGHGPRERF